MQRPQDTIGSGRWLGLLGVSALAMLSGCDCIGGSTPIGPPPRPGVECEIAPVSAILPAPGNRQYDAPVTAAVDDGASRHRRSGRSSLGKGGQKAQKEDPTRSRPTTTGRTARRARMRRGLHAPRWRGRLWMARSARHSRCGRCLAYPSGPRLRSPAALSCSPLLPPSVPRHRSSHRATVWVAPDPATPGAPAGAPQPLPVPTTPTPPAPPADPNKAFAPQPG